MGTISEVARQAAAAAAEEMNGRVRRIELESGVVLRFKHVSPLAIRAAAMRIPQPQPPMVDNPDRGRPEQNPNDPEYLKALIQWQRDQTDASLGIGIIQGTEIESVPDGMYRPEADEWIDELNDMFAALPGNAEPIVIRKEPASARYLDWMRFYALRSEVDIFRLTQILTSGLVLTEKEVADAAASFRRRIGGFADSDLSAPAAPVNGDLDQAPAAGAGA